MSIGIIFGLVVFGALPSELFAKSNLRKSEKVPTKDLIKDYNTCRKNALSSPEAPGKSKEERRAALQACLDQFPGVKTYIDCKKEALGKAGEKTKLLEQELESCRKYLDGLAFDAHSEIPFRITQDKLFFAGVGLNRKQGAENLALPNFGCDELKLAIDEPMSQEFILFGNLPQLFAGFKQESAENLFLRLQKHWKKSDEEGLWLVNNLGQINRPSKRALGPLYFPSAKCHFAAEAGSIYDGLSIYYLIDRRNREITPYFGVGFYSAQAKIKAGELAEKIKTTLGKNYRVIKNKFDVLFITKQDLGEFDKEGDPMNLCRSPRKQQYLALVKPSAKSDLAEYSLIANINNLCKFGDDLTIQF